MDPFIIAAIISAIVIIILSVTFLKVSNPKLQNKPKPQAVVQGDGGPGRVQAVRNQRARMRANAARNQAAIEEEVLIPDEREDNMEVPPEVQKLENDDKMGAKKRAKLEAKLEKKKVRQAEEYFREERKKQEEILKEERRKIEEKAEEEERQREEEEKRIEEEMKKRQQAEYEALKSAFTVEGEGFDEEDEGQENTLTEFINFVQTQKVVVLEDLAAHFKLKTQAVIDRIADLQASGELTGVIDDRGKFIFISMSELEDVAKFIKQRGRVSITDLAESSNNLINLNPVSVP